MSTFTSMKRVENILSQSHGVHNILRNFSKRPFFQIFKFGQIWSNLPKSVKCTMAFMYGRLLNQLMKTLRKILGSKTVHFLGQNFETFKSDALILWNSKQESSKCKIHLQAFIIKSNISTISQTFHFACLFWMCKKVFGVYPLNCQKLNHTKTAANFAFFFKNAYSALIYFHFESFVIA